MDIFAFTIDRILFIVIGLPIFILVGTFHEYAHAWMAQRLGDYTARIEGRLTLNPLKHLDPWGTLLMVFAGFGWMKPVPVNTYNFKNPVQDMAKVAFAGPLINFVLAFAGLIVINLLNLTGLDTLPILPGIVDIFVYINIILALFNLLPIPPLDGSRLVRLVLPKNLLYYWDQAEDYSFVIILLIFFTPIGDFFGRYLFDGTTFIMNLLTVF